jgi:hypothetical protein
MNGIIRLLIHSFKRSRTLVLSMALVLSAFQLVLIVVARSIQGSGGFEELSTLLPASVREMLGPPLVSFMSFAGIVSLGYFHLSVIGSLTALAISIATMPASEIETGFIDLILSRPLARHWMHHAYDNRGHTIDSPRTRFNDAGNLVRIGDTCAEEYRMAIGKADHLACDQPGLSPAELEWRGLDYRLRIKKITLDSCGSRPNQSRASRRFATTVRLIW